MDTQNKVVVDPKEAAFAIGLLNDAIPEWNRRERGQLAETADLFGPVGGLQFICPSRRHHRVVFRHVASGRVYGIVAPRYRPWVSQPALSFRRVLLDPDMVRRVDRLFPLE